MKRKNLFTGLTIIPIVILAFGLLLVDPMFVRRVEGFPQGADPTPKLKAPAEIGGEVNRRRENPGVSNSRKTTRRSNVASQLEQALSRGDAALNYRQYAHAEKEYRRALTLAPNDFRAYCGLGDIFREQTRDSDAVDAYVKCVRSADARYAHNRLGSVYLSQQRYQEAIEQFEKSIKLDPNDPTDHYNLCVVYDAQSRYSEAIEHCRKALEVDGKYANAYNQLGDVYYAQKRYPEAGEQYQKAIELEPRNAVFFNNLGLVYYLQRRYPAAIEQYKKAIEVDPKYGLAYYFLGLAYSAQQRYPEAIEQFKVAMAANPNYDGSYYHLGLAYVYTNNKTAAMEQYEALKNMKSDYADALLSEISKPQLAFTKQEDFKSSGQNWTRYYFSVTNRASYPNEMFAQSPDLPPCGENPNSSRTWVDIFDEAGTRLQGFCALGSSADLALLWFALPKGQTHPSSVFIVLNDRRANVEYKSSLAAIP